MFLNFQPRSLMFLILCSYRKNRVGGISIAFWPSSDFSLSKSFLCSIQFFWTGYQLIPLILVVRCSETGLILSSRYWSSAFYIFLSLKGFWLEIFSVCFFHRDFCHEPKSRKNDGIIFLSLSTISLSCFSEGSREKDRGFFEMKLLSSDISILILFA